MSHIDKWTWASEPSKCSNRPVGCRRLHRWCMGKAWDTPYGFIIERLAQHLDSSIVLKQLAVLIVWVEGIQHTGKAFIRRDLMLAKTPCTWYQVDLCKAMNLEPLLLPPLMSNGEKAGVVIIIHIVFSICGFWFLINPAGLSRQFQSIWGVSIFLLCHTFRFQTKNEEELVSQ